MRPDQASDRALIAKLDRSRFYAPERAAQVPAFIRKLAMKTPKSHVVWDPNIGWCVLVEDGGGGFTLFFCEERDGLVPDGGLRRDPPGTPDPVPGAGKEKWRYPRLGDSLHIFDKPEFANFWTEPKAGAPILSEKPVSKADAIKQWIASVTKMNPTDPKRRRDEEDEASDEVGPKKGPGKTIEVPTRPAPKKGGTLF